MPPGLAHSGGRIRPETRLLALANFSPSACRPCLNLDARLHRRPFTKAPWVETVVRANPFQGEATARTRTPSPPHREPSLLKLALKQDPSDSRRDRPRHPLWLEGASIALGPMSCWSPIVSCKSRWRRARRCQAIAGARPSRARRALSRTQPHARRRPDDHRDIDIAIQLRSARWQLGEFACVVKATVVSWAVSRRWFSGG
jgi:hypothetical protein